MKTIQRLWNNFWYKYIPPDSIAFGSARRGRYEFRKERLVLTGILLVIILELLIVL